MITRETVLVETLASRAMSSTVDDPAIAMRSASADPLNAPLRRPRARFALDMSSCIILIARI
ncbi:hypothetical protein [Lysobacter capsici]|uniref:hypothetical protein n=1 Tax=Lysobacter capsici TaxID=435897 RepID=UPI00287B83B4|nr:hypothetical protein [Lysobacter capsici]WND82080.1 hypothetical protein RJ610_06875 [Lysobacter capsici]